MTAPADLKEIVARLEPLLGPSDGEPAPLDGGITNRNYRARLGGEDYVIRRPTSGRFRPLLLEPSRVGPGRARPTSR